VKVDNVDCATEKGHCPEPLVLRPKDVGRSALGLLDPGAQGPRALAQGQRVQGVGASSLRPSLSTIGLTAQANGTEIVAQGRFLGQWGRLVLSWILVLCADPLAPTV
jgi:hypothetical protein